jgi:hypothetical protein
MSFNFLRKIEIIWRRDVSHAVFDLLWVGVLFCGQSGSLSLPEMWLHDAYYIYITISPIMYI